MNQFVHLHLHTHFSFLDASNKIPELMRAAEERNMPAIAVTEHGNLCSARAFYKGAKNHGIKPIIGCEVYVTPGSHTDRSANNRKSNHLVLLAENATGYHNLIKLVSKAHLDGMYYRPRIDHALLEQYNEGLICTSACMSGEVAVAILNGDEKEAMRIAGMHKDIFGDRYYLEIQENEIEEQATVNAGVVKLAKKLDIPLVATNDCHYLNREDWKSHDVLLCVGTGKTVNETKRKRYGSSAFYLRDAKEMSDLFADYPQAIKSTLEIAERCNLEMESGGFIFPGYDTPRGMSLDDTIREMSFEGLQKRMRRIERGYEDTREFARNQTLYPERMETELSLICERGFAGYLLIVQDFMNWARDRDIPVGPGRGSAAGSLVCFALGITDIDPLRYGLLFERFMNPERQDNPDIDCDFCANGRDRVIEYVTEKYGADNVCQIGTFATMKAKAVIRDVGRALGYPYADVDKVAKLVPDALDITLDKAHKEDSEFRGFIEENAWAKELFDNARALEGITRHIGKHAAGVVIAPEPLTEYVPLTRDKDGLVITQWDKNDVEESGLIKFDFLGLKTLTVIDKALDLIRRTHGEAPDLNTIPMNDPKAFELLCSGHTTGVFQLESKGMKDLLIRIAPSSIDDIVALVALYRPGPIGSGMIDDFIAAKKGEIEVTYELPVLEEFLEETYGMMVYQEQVMQVATAVGGLSLGASDLMRRAMSKKKLKDMEKFQVDFTAGAKDKGIDPQKAGHIWDLMEKFAAYGFNKSHSAAYGVVAYQTAYLKANYPLEFMAALLTMDADNTDKLATKINEVREMKYEILPPSINKSERDFLVEGDKIRFGLAGIKNVGEGAIEAIVSTREKTGPFTGVTQMLEEVGVAHLNKRVVESLVKAGCFDDLQPNRARLLAGVDKLFDHATRVAREKASGQSNLFGAIGGMEQTSQEVPLPDAEPLSDAELLDVEKEAFGFFLTGHPLRQYETIIKRYTNFTCETLKETQGRVSATVAAVITDRRFRDTSRGRMAILQVEDLTGVFEAIVYNEAFVKCETLLRGDAPLLLTGKAECNEKGPKIYVDEAHLLADAHRAMGEEVHIHLPQGPVADGTIEMLQNILRKSGRGACRPVLHYVVPGTGEVLMKFPKDFSVRPSDELVASVEQLLGRDVVMFS
ncbi:MAG: DNA polymerase III subunit alpha [Deltaproteobacteria bacterium]|nr:DNA polymerase III subunit alpha [bacterium]MCB9477164.1 DNA polymerase III subunit alpha [Deltaproteobacteria bacterium]MCB9488152.1 DNA polymerase III subunit alpha [Deltaproteobacteria bacterium]